MFSSVFFNEVGWRDGLMVDVLDFGKIGLGSSPCRGLCVDTLLSHAVPLSTQVYEWVPVNLMREVSL